jgi:hypothetical protein
MGQHYPAGRGPSKAGIGISLAVALALAILVQIPAGALSGRLSVGENPPRIDILSSASPDRIWPEGVGGEPGEARVSIELAGAGDPSFTFEPQDTVFVMDRSGSMAGNDPGFLRVVATQKYVERMIPPDRGCVVSFADAASLVNGHGLSSDYARIKADLATVGYSSGTNLDAALSAATAELESHGAQGKMQLEILLTDGIPDPPEANVTLATVQRIQDRGVMLYTIGLGADLDESLLKWLANLTGGVYYHASSAAELEEIYLNISNGFKNFTAAIGMRVHEVLAPGVHLVPGSASPEPAATGSLPSGDGDLTFIDWSVPRLNLSQAWSASYRVTLAAAGWTPLRANRAVYGNSSARLDYVDWSGSLREDPLPELELCGILPVPPPPPAFLPPAAAPPPPPPPPPPLLPVYSPAMPVAVQPSIVMVSQSSPPLYVFAPLLGLGAGRLLQKVRPTRLRGMGIVSPHNRRQVRELVKEREKHEF